MKLLLIDRLPVCNRCGSLQWVIFSFNHIVYTQVNYKGVDNSCLNPVSLCPAHHCNPFEVSMQMSWFKPQTFKCWVSILWYLKSPVYHYYLLIFWFLLSFTLPPVTVGCNSFHTNEIYLNKTYLLTDWLAGWLAGLLILRNEDIFYKLLTLLIATQKIKILNMWTKSHLMES